MAAGGRVLAVCADDVGLVDGVADTVVALAAGGRLSAASCLASAPDWQRSAKVVAYAAPSLELGLHFNLSEGAPLSAELRRRWPTLPGLAHLLAAAALRSLPLAAIAAEFRAQVGAFGDALGRAPAFIDGHQHVHALPGVREIVLDAVAAWPSPPAIRNTGRVCGPGAPFKRRIIEASGGRALQRSLRTRGIAHNHVLLGAYDFATIDYRGLVQRWLAAAPREGGLLFCHPCARAVDSAADPIAVARRREADYLGSAAFAEDLAAAGVTVGPAWPRRSSSAD
jgi:chitin disaccharide deacetylase